MEGKDVESTRTPTTGSGLTVLVATAMYPSADYPARGSFVAAQVESLRAEGVEVHVLAFPPRIGISGYLRAIREVRASVRAIRPHVVHAHYGWMGFVCLWQRTPVVTSFCGDDLQGTEGPDGRLTVKSRVGMLLSQIAAIGSAVTICKSAGLRARIWSRRVRDRTAVIPNGVDGRRFHPGDQAAARQRVGVGADRRIVFFPNTPTEPNKRLWLAQQAVDAVGREIDRVDLVVPANQHIPHERMPDWYRAADVVLLTSLREGSPNVVKEAIACGVPVVSTDVGDVREWLDATTGVIVEGTEPEIAAAVKRVLIDPPTGNPGRVMHRISSEAVARRLIELYRKAAGQGRPSHIVDVPLKT